MGDYEHLVKLVIPARMVRVSLTSNKGEKQEITRETILEEAKKCVCQNREQQYGSPEDNFECISKLWSVYKDIEITPLDVAVMMCLMKEARIKTGTATADSFVDIAGYAACGGEIAFNGK